MDEKPRLLAGSRQHLADNDLSYLGHMRVAFGIGARLMIAGLACLLHGLVPGAFTDSASRIIRRLHAGLADRAPRSPMPGGTAEAEA